MTKPAITPLKPVQKPQPSNITPTEFLTLPNDIIISTNMVATGPEKVY